MAGETRERLRSNQACLNCRRKKARCPAERPACSTCIRLKQRCVYTSRAAQESRTQDRLAYLEKKLDLILNEGASSSVPSSSNQHESLPAENLEASQEEAQETMQDVSVPSRTADIQSSLEDQQHAERSSASVDSRPCFNVPGLTVSPSELREAVHLYFRFCHRQPIWCFERQDLDNPDGVPAELASSLMELTSRFSTDRVLTQSYGNHARWLIMQRVASSTIGIGTIESLCLLSYSAFLDGDSQLGQFYLGLGFQLCYSAILDPAPTTTDGVDKPATEREKKVFWSLQSLVHFYNHQHGIIGIPYSILRPFFDYSAREDPQLHESRVLNLPSLPRDDPQHPQCSDEGIWSYAAHFSWIWNRTRAYILECAHGRIRTPWRQESTYTAILADLTEVENKVSACHRYDRARFHKRPIHELAQNKGYWVPWLRLQFLYHSILTVLNHPFLYIMASQHNPALQLPNTFWRKSSELVLLHATWIVRMVDLVADKRLQLIEPFFGHAAAIAATVHLYFCCAADARLKRKSMADFTRCREFVDSFVSFSPACGALAQSLNQITRIASGSKNLDHAWTPSKIHLSIPHMWTVLQANTYSTSPDGFLHPAHPATSAPTSASPSATTSTSTTQLPQPTATSEKSTIEIKIAISPDVTVNHTADDPHNAGLPPFHVTEPSGATGSPRAETAAGPDIVVAPGNALMSNTPWLWASASPGFGGEEAGMFDSIAGMDLFSGLWEAGNL